MEQLLGTGFVDRGLLFGHGGRVVVGDLPFVAFLDVSEGVSGLDLVSSGTHGEFVDSGILGPAVSHDDLALRDNTLGLQLQKVVKVVLDGGVVGTGSVGHGRKQNRVGGVTAGNLVRVKGGQGVVPEVEQGAHFTFGNSSGGRLASTAKEESRLGGFKRSLHDRGGLECRGGEHAGIHRFHGRSSTALDRGHGSNNRGSLHLHGLDDGLAKGLLGHGNRHGGDSTRSATRQNDKASQR